MTSLQVVLAANGNELIPTSCIYSSNMNTYIQHVCKGGPSVSSSFQNVGTRLNKDCKAASYIIWAGNVISIGGFSLNTTSGFFLL